MLNEKDQSAIFRQIRVIRVTFLGEILIQLQYR